MTIKRIVDVSFWEDPQVIDHFSIEDRYFYLYLLTNPNTTQLGIYTLPIKTISDKTGFSREVVLTLLDRFQEKLQVIRYSKKTQEIAVLNSLRTSIVKGGVAVERLLKKEVAQVKDLTLIQATLTHNTRYFRLSNRSFDQKIYTLLQEEIQLRQKLLENPQKIDRQFDNENENENEKENESLFANENDNDNENQNKNDNVNVNDNQNEDALETSVWPPQLSPLCPDSTHLPRVTSPIELDDLGLDPNLPPAIYQSERAILRQRLEDPYLFREGVINNPDLTLDQDIIQPFLDFCQEKGLSFSRTELVAYNQWLLKLPFDMVREAVLRSMDKQEVFYYSMKILWNWQRLKFKSLFHVFENQSRDYLPDSAY